MSENLNQNLANGITIGGIDYLFEDTQSREDITEIKNDLLQLKTLLQQVRDALESGDIDEAISLLDTFLLDGGELA